MCNWWGNPGYRWGNVPPGLPSICAKMSWLHVLHRVSKNRTLLLCLITPRKIEQYQWYLTQVIVHPRLILCRKNYQYSMVPAAAVAMTTKQTTTPMWSNDKTTSLRVEEIILIKNVKCYDAVRLTNEFPANGWQKSTLNDLIKRLKQSGSITRKVWKRQVTNSANDRQHRRCWRTGVAPGGCSTNSQYSTRDCERNAYSSSWLNISSSTASMLAFNVLFFRPLAGNSFVSLTAS